MKKTKRKRTRVLIVAVGAATGAVAGAQGLPVAAGAVPEGTARPSSTARLGLSGSADGWFPQALDADADVSYAVGGTAQLSYAPLRFIEALARFGVYSVQLESNESLLYAGGSLGLGYVARLFERVSVSASAFAGLGKVPNYNDQSFGLYELGARLEASFRLTASMSLGVSAGFERLANPYSGSFMDALGAGLRLRLAPAELRRDRANLAFEKVETQAIFPVFRSWYDSDPLGAVTIRNDEDGPIDNVRVSFYAPEYMGGPRLCTTVGRMERGASVVVPLYAVFDERILSLTENGATSAEIDVDYSFIGSRRAAREGLALSLHHRNAMSWEDDRRAAAFVSPTDPAALWFSRYSSSVVRDRMRSELPPNLQYALGVFEALKLYGLNYVIDPNSSYIEMSENAAVVDYLQYPSQTLMYRGGDCDDLSILYCSLLESQGIATAFITIPGHIYMAFDLGLTEAAAREQFFDPGLLVFRDGWAWAPIEITMVKDGFVKAWRVGAKQWIDNDRAGTAAFYPMKENWARYKPSGLQNAQARFSLPDEARTMAAFDAGVDRFVARELEPIIAEYENKLASSRKPETLNEYGMAMARVGMLDPAWERFAEASKAGYAWAWNNLANIAFVRKDYKLAYSYYEWTTTLLPGDPVAVLGMARCAYELDRYSEASMLYAGLVVEAPTLATRYGYLTSAYGGTGRAWSMADRLAGSIWSRPGLSFAPPPVATSPAVAVAPPPATPSPVAAVETPKEPEPAAELVAAPEPEPEPAPVAVAETLMEQEPVEGIVTPPGLVLDPAPEPGPVAVQPAPSAIVQALAAAKTQTQESKAKDIEAKPKPVAPVAPPTVIDKPPEDVEIAAKAAESEAPIPIPETVMAPPPVQAPPAAPAIIEKPPVDAEIAAKAAEAAAITPPPPSTVAPPPAEPAAIQPPRATEVVAAVPVEAPAAIVETLRVAEEAKQEPALSGSQAFAPQSRFMPTVDHGGAPAFAKRLPDGVDASGYGRIVIVAPVVPIVVPTIDLSGPLVTVASGTWTRTERSASMTDPRSMYAKLVVATPGAAGPVAYEFKARATGTGWVGFGLHLHGRGSWKLSGYGGGDSLLVWITSDPKTYGDAAPRLQVYRSTGEVAMTLKSSTRIDGSAFDLRDYRVEYDPAAGTLAVYVDGEKRLSAAGLLNPPDCDFAALRALDLADFSDVRISPLSHSPDAPEKTP